MKLTRKMKPPICQNASFKNAITARQFSSLASDSVEWFIAVRLAGGRGASVAQQNAKR
jgi:hypothetical protein